MYPLCRAGATGTIFLSPSLSLSRVGSSHSFFPSRLQFYLILQLHFYLFSRACFAEICGPLFASAVVFFFFFSFFLFFLALLLLFVSFDAVRGVCSVRGCLPVTIVLKFFWRARHRRNHSRDPGSLHGDPLQEIFLFDSRHRNCIRAVLLH